ncbi:hypothetical protein ELI_13075 [Erythrobacter litoralis HTCC2594]|uniref:17 kDa surface antigen n=1 Tax=Erythrobacter litoralis (strain HTCC2594) TaxID=314225 RepID=Q2N6I4_ERYLH|nr:hypothetical protein ELI_13075 [Erythrobacter litoralis HTCC2594]
MSFRYLAAGGVAAGAMIAATPGLAAQEMSYEQRVYEYAQPLPEGEQQTVFVSDPVVQSVPAQSEYRETFGAPETDYEVGYEVQYSHPAPVATHGPAGVMHPPQPVVHPPMQHRPMAAAPHHPGYPPMPPVFDRGAWLDECRAYVRERRRRGDRGATIGGLLGAAAGGVIGNRVASSERLGGALIGAGVGGLAGLAIGSAVALAQGDPDKRNCKDWLERYEDGIANGGYYPGGYYPGYPGHGWGGQWGQSWSHGSGWSGGYVVAPVTTVVVHHGGYVPVVREIVTEEWVEETVTHKKHYHKPAEKKVRYIKQKPVKRTKYIKGK